MMDKNLLTVLTRRWGDRDSNPKTRSVEFPRAISDAPRAIGLVPCSDRRNSQAYDQAANLGRLIAGSGLMAHHVGSKPNRSEGFLKGPVRYIYELTGVIKNSELIHLIAESYLELVLTACFVSVLGRFYGKRIVVEVIGGWTTRVNRLQLSSVRSWIGLCQTVLVPSGQSDRWSRGLSLKVDETKPLIDLESISARLFEKLQPSILADCGNLTLDLGREIIAGFQIVKQKYPRTELTILVDRKSELIQYWQINKRRSAGLTVKAATTDGNLEKLSRSTDLFISCQAEPFAERKLLLAAAAGRIIIVPESSPLAEYLRRDCQFEPICFSGSSDLAGKIIHLIENPDRVRFLSRQSRGLAEQFAWDNLTSVWLDRYSRAMRD